MRVPAPMAVLGEVDRDATPHPPLRGTFSRGRRRDPATLRPDGTTLPHPGPGRGWNPARPRRDLAPPHRRGGRPCRRGGHSPGPLHRQTLSAAPGRSPSNWASTPRSSAIRGAREGPGRAPDPLAGRLRRPAARRGPRRLPRSRRAGRLLHRHRARRDRLRGRLRPDRPPPLRRLSGPEPAARRGRSLVAASPRRPPALPPLRDRHPRGDARIPGRRPGQAGRSGPDVRAEEPEVRRDDVRGPAPGCEQVDRRPPSREPLGGGAVRHLCRRRRHERRAHAPGAGLGVAMGHSPADVLAVADHVTGDHDNDGVAMLVDDVLLPH